MQTTEQQPTQDEPRMTPDEALQKIIDHDDGEANEWQLASSNDEDGFREFFNLTLAEYNCIAEMLACKRGITVRELRRQGAGLYK